VRLRSVEPCGSGDRRRTGRDTAIYKVFLRSFVHKKKTSHLPFPQRRGRRRRRPTIGEAGEEGGSLCGCTGLYGFGTWHGGPGFDGRKVITHVSDYS